MTTAIVTGATGGLGTALAEQLAERVDTLVLVGRNRDALTELASRLGARYAVADFERLDDVKRMATQLFTRCPSIDLLVNNAGGRFAERELTVDGTERTLQLNWLAGLTLTELLARRIKASEGRVVNVASVMSRYGTIDLDDLDRARRRYGDGWLAYADAKLATVLHAKELVRRGLPAWSIHPGALDTGFDFGFGGAGRWAMAQFARTPAAGAGDIVRLGLGELDVAPGSFVVRGKAARSGRDANRPELSTALFAEGLRRAGLPATQG